MHIAFRLLRHSARLMMGVAAVSILWMLVSCAGVGGVVPPEKRLPIRAGGGDSGQWTSMDADVRYRYTIEAGTPTRIRFAGSVSARFPVSQIRLAVNFLDDQGRVLGGEQLYSSPYQARPPGGEFRRTMDLPEGTEALSFISYSQPHRDRR